MRQLGGLFQRRDEEHTSAGTREPLSRTGGRAFDLNFGKVLEHWGPAEALREIIANALDEQALTLTQDPEIFWDTDGWHVRDWGRGLRYEHLTQSENQEKLDHPDEIIGKFGVGLKDALATCDRHYIQVTIRSSHCVITTTSAQKHGFDDITTLHAMVFPSNDPTMKGTDVCLAGIEEQAVVAAKQYFLKYSGETILESTKAGQVILRSPVGATPARIYVNGLRIADEPNFLFSYNITAPGKRLLKAMNRERSNVGRAVYSERVKSILLESKSDSVMDSIARDMQLISSGANKEEVNWVDITAHAVRVLNTHEKVLFVTNEELMLSYDSITRAQNDGYRPIVVNTAVADKVRGQVDFNSQPVRDLGVYVTEWNNSFQYQFVEPVELTAAELEIWTLVPKLLELAGGRPANLREIKISTTMRLGYGSDAAGVWEQLEGRIVIKRSQLSNLSLFAGTLLHEVVHAKTGAPDQSIQFEQGLTAMMGRLASRAIAENG